MAKKINPPDSDKVKFVEGIKLIRCEKMNAWLSEKDCALRYQTAQRVSFLGKNLSFIACKECPLGEKLSKKHAQSFERPTAGFYHNVHYTNRLKYDQRASELGFKSLRDALYNMLDEGTELEEISSIMGMTIHSINAYLRKYGINMTPFLKKRNLG